MKVRIQNFQSLKDVSFDFPEGKVSIITGDNNCGKSASQRGLRAAITNKFRPDDLTWGEKEASVSLEFDNGKIEWRRVEDKSIYDLEVDGKKFPTFRKTERKVPSEVSAFINMSPLEFDKADKINLNLLGQFENFFFVEESGAKISRILGKLSGVDQIFDRMKDVAEDLSGLSKNAENLNYEIECMSKDRDAAKSQYQAYLSKYTGITDCYKQYNDTRNKKQQAESVLQSVSRIRRDMFDKKGEISRLDVPMLSLVSQALKKTLSRKNEMEIVYSKVKSDLLDKNRLSVKIPVFDVVKDTAKVLFSGIERKNSVSSAYFKTVNSLNEKAKLSKSLSILDSLTEMSFQFQSSLSKISSVKSFILSLNAVSRAKDSVRALETGLKEYKESLGKIKSCPTCHRPF